MSLPLQNCVIERTMPKGYTWAKFVRCWTGDPAGARFFEEKEDDVGNTFPAAYFTTIITYDREAGWTERDIKFQGADAVWAQLELKERGQIALINCEGHIYTRMVEDDGQSFVRSTVIIKQGTVVVHALHHQTAAPTMSTPTAEPTPGLSEFDSGDAANISSEDISHDGAPF